MRNQDKDQNNERLFFKPLFSEGKFIRNVAVSIKRGLRFTGNRSLEVSPENDSMGTWLKEEIQLNCLCQYFVK